MPEYTTGTGQRILQVHEKNLHCLVHGCVIHNPTDHCMVDFPTVWHDSGKRMMRICPCGKEHPDPDDIGFIRSKLGDEAGEKASQHICCSKRCCKEKSSSAE